MNGGTSLASLASRTSLASACRRQRAGDREDPEISTSTSSSSASMLACVLVCRAAVSSSAMLCVATAHQFIFAYASGSTFTKNLPPRGGSIGARVCT